jgi:hypothetical protein
MKAAFLPLFLAALASGPPALAQTAIALHPAISDDDVVLDAPRAAATPEEAYDAPDAPYAAEIHETLRPGSTVPRDIPLRLFSVNAAPSLRGYAYFVSVDYKLVVVDPATREVVHILPVNS